MKKLYCLLAITFLIASYTKAQSNKSIPKPSAVISFVWNGNSYDTSSHINYKYNASGKTTLQQYNKYVGSIFVPDTRNRWEYNNSDNVTNYFHQKYNDTSWITNSTATYTYNSYGDIEQNSSPGNKYIYTYGNNTEPLEIIEQTTDGSGNYHNHKKQVLIYDQNNEPEQILFYSFDEINSILQPVARANSEWQRWTGRIVEPFTLVDEWNLFYGENLVTSIEYEYFYDNKWNKGRRLTAAYNNDGRLLHYTNEIWDETNFVFSYRWISSYDDFGNRLKHLFQVYDTTIPGWLPPNGNSFSYIYNPDSSIHTVYVSEEANWSSTNHGMHQYFYDNSTYVGEPVAFAFRLYPNPTSELLNLEIDAEIFKVTISDLHGRRILQVQNRRTINLQHFKAGIYLISVVSENGTSTRKFIKK